jgi:hypothetical protein
MTSFSGIFLRWSKTYIQPTLRYRDGLSSSSIKSYFCYLDFMVNDPELSGKYLGTISTDFVKVADALKEASYQIRTAGFDLPIFPISKEENPIGQLLIDKNQFQLTWNYYASFLDEFIQRELVATEKVEQFKTNYKDPDEFCCLFVIDKAFTNFVFIPYPED